MITALLVSPWCASNRPKIEEDYTLDSCRSAAAKTGASFRNPGQASGTVQLSDAGVAVEIACSHAVWEAIVNDPEYQQVYWYRENNNPKRYLEVA